MVRVAFLLSAHLHGRKSLADPTGVPVSPPGTTLEIGDGWANGDSRRWNGEMRKFVLYSEPKDAGAAPAPPGRSVQEASLLMNS